MAEDSTPIAASALEKGVPVMSRSGHQFGTVERVLEEPAQDIFHGLVVATADGRRFVDRDHVERITTAQVSCTLTDQEAAALPTAADPDRPGRWRRLRSPGAAGPSRGFVAIVRCSRGGLFETVWIPLVSFKAIRLGAFRVQWCPVHRRRELVTRVDPDSLSNEERASAARYPAKPIP